MSRQENAVENASNHGLTVFSALFPLPEEEHKLGLTQASYFQTK